MYCFFQSVESVEPSMDLLGLCGDPLKIRFLPAADSALELGVSVRDLFLDSFILKGNTVALR